MLMGIPYLQSFLLFKKLTNYPIFTIVTRAVLLVTKGGVSLVTGACIASLEGLVKKSISTEV